MREQSEVVARALIDAGRAIGMERSVDLALHVLFVRWLTLNSEKGQREWQSMITASTPDGAAAQFERLAIFRDGSDQDFADVVDNRVLRDVTERVDAAVALQSGHTNAGQSFVAATFDEVLAYLSRLGKQSGEADTPRALAELMATLTVRPGDTVLDPVCGNGTGLLVAAKAQAGVGVSGFDINPRAARRASMRLIVHGIDSGGGFGVWRGEAFSEYAPHDVDVVVAQPPWGATFTESQRNRIRELAWRYGATGAPSGLPAGDMPWLLMALDALRPAGRAAIVLSRSSLMPRCRDTHRALLDLGGLEAIVSIPAGFFRHTSIPTALWLLRAPDIERRPHDVLMLDARTLVSPATHGRVEITQGMQDIISSAVRAHRVSQPVHAAAHIARRVPVEQLDLARGLHPEAYLADAPEDAVDHPTAARTLLTGVALENFKAFRSATSVPLAPLTLVYGANSAGKSSVIQSLLLLKQSRAVEVLRTQGPIANVGGFRSTCISILSRISR